MVRLSNYLFTISLLLIFLLLYSNPAVAQPDRSNFEEADQHALNTPESVENSVPELARHLTEPFNDPYDQIRAIFRWITDRIEYDVAALDRNQAPALATDASTVLQTRSTICDGYSKLFEAIASEAGFEVKTIFGHSKGYGFDPSSESDAELETNHAWNAVKINDQWYLLDSTWGAGYINSETGLFVQAFEDHYFLTKPEWFVFDHFPEESEWQLLNRPVSASEYKNKVWVRPPFFRHNLHLSSHSNQLIESSGFTTVDLNVPKSQVVNARLSRNGIPLPMNQVMVHHKDDQAIIEVTPPQRGTYDLEVFVKEKGSPSSGFDWALTYTIKNNREVADAGFPETFGRFITKRCSVESPRTFVIDADHETEFSLNVPGATRVAVVSGSDWFDLQHQSGDHFAGTVTPKSGVIRVAAKFEGEEQYSVLLEYQAR